MSKLKQTIIRNQITLKLCMMGIVASTSVLLAFMSVPSQTPSQVSAQITPSSTLESQDTEIGFIAQDPADPVQNSTSANITQLATILPAASQPITPASFTPVSEVTENSGDSASSNGDDDDSDSSSSGSDNDNNDDNGDDNGDNDNDNDNGDGESDDGDGGGSSAFAGGGGAFAFAG
ncbi:MAG: hypothetical protein WBL68_11115 [Nitrososphaeraceae archaeon]